MATQKISELYKRSLYLNRDIDFLFNYLIIEYDMKSAGFNLIKYFKLVPDEDIEALEKLDKKQRQVKIGLLQRKDKTLITKLNEAFIEIRRMFFEANDIQDNNVLSIKKDAIVIIGRMCQITTFGNVTFVPKNKYLGYMNINKIEFYYKSKDDDLDVKGISDNMIIKHQEYMLDFIKDTFILAIESDRKTLITHLTDFVSKYRKKELDFGYYRFLDNDSMFRISDNGEEYFIEDIDDEDLDIDTYYNYFYYIIPICNIFI